MGLLLLRAAVGATAVVQGSAYIAEGVNPTLGGWVAGMAAVASGAALLIGFLTPVAGLMAGLDSAFIALSWVPASTPNLLDARLSIVFVVTMAVALALL